MLKYGTLHTRKKKNDGIYARAIAEQTKRAGKQFGEEKQMQCPDSIETVHKNTNREFRDKIVVIHWIKSPVK